MRRRSGYRWIETLLLLVGIIFVGIWAWEEIKTEAVQNWESWSFERQRAGQPVNIADYLKAKEEQVVETVKTWCGFPPPPEPPAPPHFVVTERPVAPPPVQPPPLEENALIGRIAIPRLHLSTTVREGVGSDTLSVAAGHIPGTATPGPVGNVAVAGHRDTLFRGLRNIRKKDIINFETLGGTYSYQVESTQIVKPKDVAVLQPGPYPELTLVTCYPFSYVGSAPDRFIVKARQIGENTPNEEASAALQKLSAKPVNPKTPRSNEPPEGPSEIASAARHVAAHAEQPSEKTVEKPDDAVATSSAAMPGAATADRRSHPAEAAAVISERRNGVQKVNFQVERNHSRELAPGILLGITSTNPENRRANGWMWVNTNRRTIWLRNQHEGEPLTFYDGRDGKRHEVVITRVTDDFVAGYLLMPEGRRFENVLLR